MPCYNSITSQYMKISLHIYYGGTLLLSLSLVVGPEVYFCNIPPNYIKQTQSHELGRIIVLGKEILIAVTTWKFTHSMYV